MTTVVVFTKLIFLWAAVVFCSENIHQQEESTTTTPENESNTKIG